MRKEPAIRLRITYEKIDALRFISHRDLIQVLTRALRRAHVPLAYTQGFSPRPKLSFAPPLPLGVKGAGELLDIELTRHQDEEDFILMANKAVPQGLRFIDATNLLAGAPGLSSLISRCRYRFRPLSEKLGDSCAQELLTKKSIIITKQRKKDKVPKEVEVRNLLHSLTEEEDGAIVAEVTATPQTISPFAMAKLLWPALENHALDDLDITRLGFLTVSGKELFKGN